MLAETGNIKESCVRAACSRNNVYKRRNSDPDFAAAMHEALEDAVEALELIARERASKSSDVLLIFLLKSLRPTVYRDNVRHEHSGPDGGKIQQEITHEPGSLLGPYIAFALGLGRDLEGAPPPEAGDDGSGEPFYPPEADQPAGQVLDLSRP